MQNQDENKFDGLLCNFKVNDDGKIIGIQGSPNFSEECEELINSIDSHLQHLFGCKEKMDKHRKFKDYENEIYQLSNSIRDLKENAPQDESLPQKEKLLQELHEKKPPRSFKLGSSFELEINEELNDFDEIVKFRQNFNENVKNVLKDFEKNERERADVQFSDNTTMELRKLSLMKLNDDKKMGWMEYLFGYAIYNNFTSPLSLQQELKASTIDHENVRQAIKDTELYTMPTTADQASEDSFKAKDSNKYRNLIDRLAK